MRMKTVCLRFSKIVVVLLVLAQFGAVRHYRLVVYVRVGSMNLMMVQHQAWKQAH